MRIGSFIFALWLIPAAVWAGNWQMHKTITLKKDQFSEIVVKSEGFEKLLKFRWTLYKNGGLVVIRHYDGFVGHHMLYLRNKNRSFRVELLPPGEKYGAVPYILIKFSDFDFEKGEAVFDLFMRDEDNDLLVDILKENR